MKNLNITKKKWKFPLASRAKQILGCAFLGLTSLTQLHAQGPITGTITAPTNTVINSVCDLNLCGTMNRGSAELIGAWFSTMASPSTTNTGFTNLYSTDLYDGTFYSTVLKPFCLRPKFNTTLNAGIQKLYLIGYEGCCGLTCLDSITVNIVNPIIPITPTYTVYPMPGGTSGEQVVSVSNLNPSATYTIISQVYSGFSTHHTETFNSVTGSSSYSYTFNPNYSGGYNFIWRILNPCHIGDTLLDDYSITINDPCNSYASLIYTTANNACVGDTLNTVFIVQSNSLTPGSNNVLYVNWGDGTAAQSYTTSNSTSGTDGITYPAPHVFNSLGVFTFKAWVVNSANSMCYMDTLIGTVNMVKPSCGNVNGIVYNDINNSCAKDANENGLAYIEVVLTQGAAIYYAWTDANGNYTFYDIPVGSYTIKTGNISSAYTITCANSQAHGTTVGTGIATENFALNCNGQGDVGVTGISLYNGFYPGQQDAILPHIGSFVSNFCNASANNAGQVKIVLDPCITYNPANNYNWLMPDAVVLAPTGDTLIWNVANVNNIGNFSYWDYAFAVNTCTNAQVGDSACITVIITTNNADANSTNNIYTQCFEIGVSYDPNFKEVSPKGVGSQGYISANTPELKYTVHFQNTGTAKAFNIYVLDTLSQNLDYSTLKILSSSHPMQTYDLQNRAIKFMFANIMLVDSTHDEPNSHGYVTYSIKPKANLVPATQIKNTAYIYFDYNSPIVTNTTLNTIELTAGLNEYSNNSLVNLYPNPTSALLNVSSKTVIASLRVIDIAGRDVMIIKSINNNSHTLNTSMLDNGTYILEIINTQGEKAVKKFVKMGE